MGHGCIPETPGSHSDRNDFDLLEKHLEKLFLEHRSNPPKLCTITAALLSGACAARMLCGSVALSCCFLYLHITNQSCISVHQLSRHTQSHLAHARSQGRCSFVRQMGSECESWWGMAASLPSKAAVQPPTFIGASDILPQNLSTAAVQRTYC